MLLLPLHIDHFLSSSLFIHSFFVFVTAFILSLSNQMLVVSILVSVPLI
jgi:hypothetical protein